MKQSTGKLGYIYICNKVKITVVRKHLVSLAWGVADRENRMGEPGGWKGGDEYVIHQIVYSGVCLYAFAFPTNNAPGNARWNGD